MPDPPKRTINAKLILQDIQAGMDEAEIKSKYRLSDKGYWTVIQKLSAIGAPKEPEPPTAAPTPRADPKPTRPQVSVTWRCPSCGTPQTRAYDECPHCGVIVAKVSAMQHAPGPPLPASFSRESRQDDSGAGRRAVVVVFTIVVLVVVGGVLLKRSPSQRNEVTIGAVERTSSQPGEVAIDEAEFPSAQPSEVAIGDVELPAPQPSQIPVGHAVRPPTHRPKPTVGHSVQAAGSVHKFTKGNFEQEVTNASRSVPVLVMFHADS